MAALVTVAMAAMTLQPPAVSYGANAGTTKPTAAKTTQAQGIVTSIDYSTNNIHMGISRGGSRP